MLRPGVHITVSRVFCLSLLLYRERRYIRVVHSCNTTIYLHGCNRDDYIAAAPTTAHVNVM